MLCCYSAFTYDIILLQYAVMKQQLCSMQVEQSQGPAVVGAPKKTKAHLLNLRNWEAHFQARVLLCERSGKIISTDAKHCFHLSA